MDERPWRTTPEELLRQITEPWPPPSVEALLERGQVGDEARSWARTFGADFMAAWNECPEGDWLFVFAVCLAARLHDEDAMKAVVSLNGTTPTGFGHALPLRAWPRPSAGEIRARIDGPSLLTRAGVR